LIAEEGDSSIWSLIKWSERTNCPIADGEMDDMFCSDTSFS